MGRRKGSKNRIQKPQKERKDYQVGAARFYAEPVRDTTGDEFKAIVAELGLSGHKEFIERFVALYKRDQLLTQRFFRGNVAL